MSWPLYPEERTPRTTEQKAIFAFVQMGNNGKQDGRCTFKVTWRRLRATIVAVKKKSITYSECVFAALDIQHVMHMCHIVMWPASLYGLLHSLINGTIFGKKVTEHKMCVLIFSTTFV
jgi:hypothetical protein